VACDQSNAAWKGDLQRGDINVSMVGTFDASMTDFLHAADLASTGSEDACFVCAKLPTPSSDVVWYANCIVQPDAFLSGFMRWF